MLNGVLNFALKITNWCNLNCLHCCENSGCGEPLNFMDLKKFEKYVCEFKEVPFYASEYIVITGGESFAPYLFGQPKYIPEALSCIYKVGGIPTIKTNCLWGKRADVRMNILKDLAKSASLGGKLVTLDVSVDEFHNNTSAVANVIASALSSQNIMCAVRIVLSGFNTEKSATALKKLKQELYARDLEIETLSNGDLGVYNEHGMGFCVPVVFEGDVMDLGRAKQNKVYSALWNPNIQTVVHCFVIDNNDMATLDYLYTEKVAGRKVQTVVESLARNYGD